MSNHVKLPLERTSYRDSRQVLLIHVAIPFDFPINQWEKETKSRWYIEYIYIYVKHEFFSRFQSYDYRLNSQRVASK